MGFKIDKVEMNDAEEIANIMMAASVSARIKLEFQNCKREDWLDWNIKGAKCEIEACGNFPDQAVALKAVDEDSGVIAGYAVWGWNGRAADLVFRRKVELPLPEGTDTRLRKGFVKELQEMEERCRPPGAFYELVELVTSPSFQRRGIGSQLVSYGLEKADENHIPCYLSGSPMGVLLYKKLGFEEVGRLELPLEEFGGEGNHVHVAMIRQTGRA